MKTLSAYKSEYSRAKTQTTKQRIMNKAMLNLSTDDSHKFMAWQIQKMHEENLQNS